MFALTFSFPTGRYHATPWGRHVNEADVAWPPEPWRILRALVASYWRKGERVRWSEDALARLMDALAENAPIYYLPEGAIHVHTRHYMPAPPPVRTILVFDAFAHLPKGEKIVAAWPELDLDSELFSLATDLAEGIGYLGRAESWVDCEATSDWGGEANCRPVSQNGSTAGEVVRVLAPRSAIDYAAERTRLLEEADDAERSRAAASGKRSPTTKALERVRNKAFGPTLPERLSAALTLDTADYQKYRWNRPPAAREIVYTRPPLSPVPRVPRPVQRYEEIDDRSRFTVARYLLAGRPRPRIEDAVKIGELMRLAALSKFGWENGRPKAPPVISGRGPDNQPLRDGRHSHAFWLPEDADSDGWIDHISVYAEEGFDAKMREKLDRLTRLWIGRKDSGEEGVKETGRQEWRLALEGFGRPEDFADTSQLFGYSAEWVSVTPFLAAGHLKKAGYEGEVNRLWKRREIASGSRLGPVQVEFLSDIHGNPRRAVHFHRFRSRGREKQPDAQGALLHLKFNEPVGGPLALGYACHFGLGMFARE